MVTLTSSLRADTMACHLRLGLMLGSSRAPDALRLDEYQSENMFDFFHANFRFRHSVP